MPDLRSPGFGAAADALPCGLVCTDAAGVIAAANETLLGWVGLPAAAVLGVKTLAQLLSPPGQAYWKTRLAAQIRDDGRLDEVALPLSDGRGALRQCRVSGRALPDGGMAFMLVPARPASADQAPCGSDLMAHIRQCHLIRIERMTAVGAWAFDPATEVIEASDRVFEILGLPAAGGLTLAALLGRVAAPEDRAALRAQIARFAQTGAPIKQEITIATPAGQLRRLQFRAEPEAQGAGQMSRIVGVVNDITQEHEDQQLLWRAANIDEMTGLGNRRWFQRQLQTAVEDGGPLALVLLDIDDFDAVNDLIGADAADALLREIAGRLAGLVGTPGIAARLSGDEFALLLPDPDPDAAAQRLVQLARTALAAPFSRAAPAITTTIGMATAPTDATDAEGLLRCARQALSELKTEPPGSAAFLRGPMRARFESRRAAIALVQQAAREGRILAHYQPKVRLETRQLAGYEALARIRAADGTVTGPEVWGAALDDVDCARLVDVEVLDAVLSDLVTDAARLIRVGVNFSEYSLRSVDFADRLLARLAARGLAPALLELEVVETVLVGQRMGPLAQGFARLRAAGMRIALDDFGTGFASLSHLRDLPIDRIKLDKSFVLGLGADHRNAPILRAIIDLACLLGLETVAEGIETDEAMVFLRGLGCREGQGFRFGPARPLAELPDPRQATNPRPKPGNSWASRQVSKLKGTAWWS